MSWLSTPVIPPATCPAFLGHKLYYAILEAFANRFSSLGLHLWYVKQLVITLRGLH